ncbi:hypothetical protein ABT354_22910 [Streptomyces sp. NPDC000594]|uniref:hypothetical protein n=1 Tax=Streptomyces sp. NPDC000594 TaxID=3154261 RepID=UPI00333004A4
MSLPELTPPEAARWAALAGIELDPARHAVVAATAAHMFRGLAELRAVELGDTPPATTYDPAGDLPGEAASDAAQ